jgi:hypothetical protein
MRTGLNVADSTPAERVPRKSLDDLRHQVRRLELLTYAALAISGGLLVGAIVAVYLTML